MEKARQEYLAQKREGPYGDFIEMVYKLLLHSKNGTYTQTEMIKDLSSFSREITLWGSKEVVTEWVQFRKNANMPEDAMKNLLVIHLGKHTIMMAFYIAFYLLKIQLVGSHLKKFFIAILTILLITNCLNQIEPLLIGYVLMKKH